MMDSAEVIGRRLDALRIELKFKTDQEFADAIGLSKGQYSLVKNGERRLSFATACVIRDTWGFPIDWLFYGDFHKTTALQIMAKIGRGPEADHPEPARKRQRG
jgi:transcriptional regulator with XRE-family HTH domain